MKTIDTGKLTTINGKWHLEREPYTGIGKTNRETFYYKDGKYHRDNGLPARELADGSKEWYVNGYLHRDNGLPAIEGADGTQSWWVNGKCHRDNGLPAIELADGTKHWLVNGNLHRDNGLPAEEYADGTKAWYVNGKPIYSWEQYQKATNCSKEQLVMYKLTHGNI